MGERRRDAFGDFLRSRRERLDPEALGLPMRAARRVRGLRREEVAARAGIGVDWYVRLEQGRAVTPSEATLDALAHALCLGEAERLHLRRLARGEREHAFAREHVPDAIRRIVERLDQPAYVTGRRWDVLAWNDAAVDVFLDFGQLAEAERNILIYMLTDARARALFGDDWVREAQRMVALFRTSHDVWEDDPAFVDLLARLRAGCPELDGWWRAHDVRDGGTGRKLLLHPRRGPLAFDYATFQANDDPALKLAIYTLVDAAPAKTR